MNIIRLSTLLASTSLVVACGAGALPPTERLASAEAAARSARELGAEKDSRAALHLKLAEEQLEQAKKLVNVDKKRAEAVALRASSDAELAVMLAKERSANEEAQKVEEKLKSVKGGTQ